LEPILNAEKDTVKYVSTEKVVQEINRALEGKTHAKLLVIAQPDHLRRCMKVVKKLGHDSVAVQHEKPDAPYWYDQQSGQLWTRTRHLYLLHDMIGQLSLHRQRKNEEAKIKGICA
jgi:hypothetical protein